MKDADRRAATAAYKERKETAGLFAVRCTAAGLIWVGRSLSLDSVQNRIWFTLRLGSNPNTAMQQAWDSHGAEGFTFLRLEALPEDEPDWRRSDSLKKRQAHWRGVLKADPV